MLRFCFLPPLLCALLCAATAHAFPAEVLSVHDGDSITARRVEPVRQKPLKIRVYGIDCPELGQPYGNEARELAARILKGKTVEAAGL